VLGGIVTAPVLLTGAGFVTWHGRRELRKQSTTSIELDHTEAEFTAAERRTALVLVRSRQVRSILRKLAAATAARLADFAALVEANDDYATYTDPQRREIATLVGLVTATVAVMAAPLVDDAGMAPDLRDRHSPPPRTVLMTSMETRRERAGLIHVAAAALALGS
jgi:hypothetical protein